MARAIAHVVGAELPKEFIEHRVRLAVDVRDEGVVVVLVQFAEKVPDQLVLVERLANRRQFRGKPLHLGEVFVGAHGQLLGVIQLALKMLNLGAIRSLEHAVNLRPSLDRSIHAKDM
jgi:hypothetical protein